VHQNDDDGCEIRNLLALAKLIGFCCNLLQQQQQQHRSAKFEDELEVLAAATCD